MNERSYEVSCDRCSISGLCFPAGLGDADRAELNKIVQRARPLRRGAHLFRAGDRAESVYALRTGSLKCYIVTPGGEEHVTGFYLPGEVVGLESLASGVYVQNAVALDTALICRIPLDRYEQLSDRLPALRRQLVNVLSRELFDMQGRLIDAQNADAPAALAGFLFGLAHRLHQRGLYSDRLTLPMSRGDIASFLGLTLETVSRMFMRLQSDGVIEVHARDIRIIDQDRLKAAAGFRMDACVAGDPDSTCIHWGTK